MLNCLMSIQSNLMHWVSSPNWCAEYPVQPRLLSRLHNCSSPGCCLDYPPEDPVHPRLLAESQMQTAGTPILLNMLGITSNYIILVVVSNYSSNPWENSQNILAKQALPEVWLPYARQFWQHLLLEILTVLQKHTFTIGLVANPTTILNWKVKLFPCLWSVGLQTCSTLYNYKSTQHGKVNPVNFCVSVPM